MSPVLIRRVSIALERQLPEREVRPSRPAAAVYPARGARSPEGPLCPGAVAISFAANARGRVSRDWIEIAAFGAALRAGVNRGLPRRAPWKWLMSERDEPDNPKNRDANS